MPLFCPVTGIKVFSRPEWTNKKVSDTLESSFSIIGNYIVYSSPAGKSDLAGIKKTTRLKAEVVKHLPDRNGPYIQIQDYRALHGSSLAARKYFIQSANEDKRLHALIFCNLSTPLSLAVKIGKQFNTTDKTVHITKHYADAIKLALKYCDQLNLKQDILTRNRKFLFVDSSHSLRPTELVSNTDWDIKTPEFSNCSVLIDQCILHSVSKGNVEAQHVPLIDYMRYQCHSSLPTGSTIKYIVVDSSLIKGGSREGRINFMHSLKKWHQKFPFRMYILYGGNTFITTAAYLARPFMPFKVKIAQDFKNALDIIREDRLGISNIGKKKPEKKRHQDQHSQNIEELLSFIGSIDWEVEGLERNVHVEEQHPFHILYQSIKLIKEELDSLFADRKEAELEKERVELQLRQTYKMEAIGTMAGGIAHDFNNLLSVIIGNAEFALDDIPGDSIARHDIGLVIKASFKARDLVRQILTFTRQTEKNAKPVNVIEASEDSIKLIRSATPTSIEIRKTFELDDCAIIIDPTQFHQVMLNLCTNAIQAMHNKGVLELCLEEVNLTDEDLPNQPGKKSGMYICLSVSDTGVGVSAATIDRMFDPFFTTRGVGEGTGMGLAVVHGIVDNHGGFIKVESETNKGSTFHVYFPKAKKRPFGEADAEKNLPTGNERVLFVDDEIAVAEIGGKMLERFGYAVTIQTSSTAALEMFRSKPDDFDLIVTDMTMPDLTGKELSEEILKIRPDIPIILCTGYNAAISKESAAEIGVREFCEKPLDKTQLAKVVRRALDFQL